MQPGDRVRNKSKVYDRNHPHLYSAEKGSLGRVRTVVTVAGDGTVVARVDFGLCQAVVNVDALELA
jgi:hypothetical protein